MIRVPVCDNHSCDPGRPDIGDSGSRERSELRQLRVDDYAFRCTPIHHDVRADLPKTVLPRQYRDIGTEFLHLHRTDQQMVADACQYEGDDSDTCGDSLSTHEVGAVR